jgi:chorismate dehydratase
MLSDRMELVTAYPSSIATMLLDNQIDLGLVPVAIIPQMREAHIVSGYGIACDGPVASVCLFSEVPVGEIEEVMLDYQSRTSVRLSRILLKEYWNIEPVFTDARDDFRSRIGGKRAAIIIGDRALEQAAVSPYVYDLGEAWKKHTGLPFIFAAWVSNKPLDPAFLRDFEEANRFGLENLEEVIAQHPYNGYSLKKYYTENICYTLTPEMHQGMQLFLEKIALMGL